MFLLMAQYNGAAIVPLEVVCRDFFSHLTVEKLLRKALRGEIALPIVRIERSQKAHRGVHLADLADYIDKRRAADGVRQQYDNTFSVPAKRHRSQVVAIQSPPSSKGPPNLEKIDMPL
jgi:hypothetical protein